VIRAYEIAREKPSSSRRLELAAPSGLPLRDGRRGFQQLRGTCRRVRAGG
jgi:hypothetical protein